MELDVQSDYRCRVCLNITKHALYLQEHISGKVEALSYMEVLMLCCNIKISLDDGKPKKICLTCMENARTSYEFKICCERSNSILENEIYTTSRDNCVGNIKHEDAYDSFSVDPLKNGIKEILLVPDKTAAGDLYQTTISDINLVKTPIAKYAEEIHPKIEEVMHTTATNNCATDSHLNDDNLSTSKNTEKLDEQDITINKVYKCSTCDKSYMSRQGYNKHIIVCNNLHNCSTCGLKYKSFGTLLRHIRQKHTVVGKCSFCDTILIDDNSLIAHTKEYHSDKLGENILCEICGAVFEVPYYLRKHMEKHHKILYECKHCDFSTNYHEGFLGHMQDEHCIVEIVEDKDFRKTLAGIRKCEYCNFTTTNMIKFGKHRGEEHKDKKTIACDKCDKKFFTTRQLSSHRMLKHRTDGKKVICEVCGMQFPIAENLKRHMLRHTGEKPHKCNICSKAFSQSATLGLHMKFHSEERNVKCDVCGKRFKTKNCLRTHNLTHHDRQLNYKCPVCDKAFISKSSLDDHNLVHTGLRLYKCEVCNRGFGRKHHLKTHMRTHTGEKPHVCHLCGKGFSQAVCLRTHLLKH